jgi:phage-related protein
VRHLICEPAIFHPAAITAIRQFPEIVRKELGKAIFDLQCGDVPDMPLSRPMASVAGGVSELRIRDRSGIYRAFYRAFYYTQSPRGILGLHAFSKKTRATPKHELKLARKRLKELLNEEI